ncbi:hypothetical protein FRX31_017104, partial [Thalictrum thalictroides]
MIEGFFEWFHYRHKTTVRSSTTFGPGMYFYSRSIDQPRIPQAQQPWPASNTVAPSSNSNFSRFTVTLRTICIGNNFFYFKLANKHPCTGTLELVDELL